MYDFKSINFFVVCVHRNSYYSNNYQSNYSNLKYIFMLSKLKRTLAPLVILISTAAFAQQSQQAMTLDQCIATGLQRNYALRSAAASVYSAEGSKLGAFGQFLPNVSLSAGYSHNLNGHESFFTTPQGLAEATYSYSASGSVTETLFNGFSNTAGYNESVESYDAAEFNYERIRQTTVYQIVQDYVAVEDAEQLMKAQEQNLAVGKDQLDQVQAQYKVGTVPFASVLTQQTQTQNDEVTYIQSKNTWNTNRNNLVAFIGLDPVSEYMFDTTSLPTNITDLDQQVFRQKIGDIKAAADKALELRPDVVSLHRTLESASSGVTVALSNYYPTLSGSFSYGWRNDAWADFGTLGTESIGLNLSIPIFDQFQATSSVQIADATYQIDLSNYDQLVQQVRTQVKQAYYDLSTAEETLMATDIALKSADENRRNALESFKVGAGTELQYLTAQSQWLTAASNRINAVYGYQQAQYEVEYMIGTLQSK